MNKSDWIQQLIRDGLREIETKYGPRGLRPQAYHNAEHARDVMQAVGLLGQAAARARKINAAHIPLLELAACYHDIEHDLEAGNESASANYLVQKMQQTNGFNHDEINLCKSCILATAFHFVDGHFAQAAGDDYYTKLVADADMANTGKAFDVFLDRSWKLYAEHAGGSLTPRQKQAIAPKLIKFLESHSFLTPEAARLFPHKSENIARLRA
jgi:predicted metal-dependent HD superfamily phosphohydrolase